MIIADVVHLKSAAIAVAQDHVGLAEAAEVAEAPDLPVQSDRAQRDRTSDVVVGGNVIDLECAADGVPQQHVAGIAIVETAERDKTPFGSNLPQPVRS